LLIYSARLALPISEKEISTLGTPISVETDIEDFVPCASEGNPVINIDEFTQNRKKYMDLNTEDVNMLSASVFLMPEAGSIPTPKAKNVSRLRTEHQAYVLSQKNAVIDNMYHYSVCLLYY
jgi:hypothetical protein